MAGVDGDVEAISGTLAEWVLAADPHELDRVFTSAFERFGRAVAARAVSVWVIEPALRGSRPSGGVVRTRSWGPGGDDVAVDLAEVASVPFGAVLAGDQAVVIRRASMSPELLQQLDRALGYRLETGLMVPVVWGGDVRGLLSVGWGEVRDVPQDVVDAARHLARAVERALQRERRLVEGAQRAAVDELVAEVATLLLSIDPLELESVLPRVLTAVSGFCGGRMALLVALTDHGGALTVRHVETSTGEPAALVGWTARHDEVAAGLLSQRRATRVDRRALTGPWRDRLDASLPEPFTSMLLSPLVVAGEVTGALVVVATDDRSWPGESTRALQHVSDLVSFALLRRRDTHALAEERARAEAADRAKTEFLSRASHELRTPLQAVLGYAQLLALDAPGARQRELLHRIERAGDHLVRLIDDVLDLGRVEAATIPLDLAAVDTVQVTREALDVVGELARRHEVAISLEPEGLAPVLADPMRLRQVLVNLCANGIQYNRRAGSVVVRGRPLGERVAVDVVDTGIGIDESQFDRMFVPFARLRLPGAGHPEGAGLGLSLAQRLVEAMAGEIVVASEPGRGSRFTVVLPAATTPPQERPARARVLCVSPHPADLDLLVEVLGSFPDLELRAAVRIDDAVDLARLERPVLVLVGGELPGIGHAEVVTALRAIDPSHPPAVVVVLPAADPDQTAASRAAGAAAVFAQPLDVPALLAEVEGILRAGRAGGTSPGHV